MAPIISIIPAAATSPILMIVGLLMLSNISRIDFSEFENTVASLLTIVMMPLCFSITAGAVFGIISYTLMKLLLGKTKDISVTLVIIAVICCGWFFIG